MRRSKLVALCFTAALGALGALGHAANARADDAANTGVANGAGAAQALGRAILARPGGAEQVVSLQDDPNVKSLLADPEAMRAIERGDLGTLLHDPRVEALMKHPTVRSLSDGLQK